MTDNQDTLGSDIDGKLNNSNVEEGEILDDTVVVGNVCRTVSQRSVVPEIYDMISSTDSLQKDSENPKTVTEIVTQERPHKCSDDNLCRKTNSSNCVGYTSKEKLDNTCTKVKKNPLTNRIQDDYELNSVKDKSADTLLVGNEERHDKCPSRRGSAQEKENSGRTSKREKDLKKKTMVRSTSRYHSDNHSDTSRKERRKRRHNERSRKYSESGSSDDNYRRNRSRCHRRGRSRESRSSNHSNIRRRKRYKQHSLDKRKKSDKAEVVTDKSNETNLYDLPRFDISHLKGNILMRKLLESGTIKRRRAGGSDLNCEVGSVSSISSPEFGIFEDVHGVNEDYSCISDVDLPDDDIEKTNLLNHGSDSEIEIFIPEKRQPELVELQSESDGEHSLEPTVQIAEIINVVPQNSSTQLERELGIVQNMASDNLQRSESPVNEHLMEDEDVLQLRLEALKSAVLKKHMERLHKRGKSKVLLCRGESVQEKDMEMETVLVDDSDLKHVETGSQGSAYCPTNRTSPISPTSSYDYSPYGGNIIEEQDMEIATDEEETGEQNKTPTIEKESFRPVECPDPGLNLNQQVTLPQSKEPGCEKGHPEISEESSLVEFHPPFPPPLPPSVELFNIAPELHTSVFIQPDMSYLDTNFYPPPIGCVPYYGVTPVPQQDVIMELPEHQNPSTFQNQEIVTEMNETEQQPEEVQATQNDTDVPSCTKETNNNLHNPAEMETHESINEYNKESEPVNDTPNINLEDEIETNKTVADLICNNVNSEVDSTEDKTTSETPVITADQDVKLINGIVEDNSTDSKSKEISEKDEEGDDDYEEQILRAQLLTELVNKETTRSGPESPKKSPIKRIMKNKKLRRNSEQRLLLQVLHNKKRIVLANTKVQENIRKKVNTDQSKKTNEVYKKNSVAEEEQQLTVQPKLVKKSSVRSKQLDASNKLSPQLLISKPTPFIINIGQDSDSDDENTDCSKRDVPVNNILAPAEDAECPPQNTWSKEMEKSVDLLLSEVRKQHEAPETSNKSQAAPNIPRIKSVDVRKPDSVLASKQSIINNKKQEVDTTSKPHSVTPLAVRHLPKSQQEEYRRLKQKILEKEKQKLQQMQNQRSLSPMSPVSRMTKNAFSQTVPKLSEKPNSKILILKDKSINTELQSSSELDKFESNLINERYNVLSYVFKMDHLLSRMELKTEAYSSAEKEVAQFRELLSNAEAQLEKSRKELLEIKKEIVIVNQSIVNGHSKCNKHRDSCIKFGNEALGQEYQLPEAGDSILKKWNAEVVRRRKRIISDANYKILKAPSTNNLVQNESPSKKSIGKGVKRPAEIPVTDSIRPSSPKQNVSPKSVKSAAENPKTSSHEEYHKRVKGNVEPNVNSTKTINSEDVQSTSADVNKPMLPDYVSPLYHLTNAGSLKGTMAAQKTDHQAILCPFDLRGSCRDDSCPYQH